MKSRIFFSLIILMFFLFGCNRDTTKTPGETGEKMDRIVFKVAHNGPEKHPFQKGYEKFKEILEAETGG